MFSSKGYITGLTDTLIADSGAFLPELILCATIVGMLLTRLTNVTRRSHMAVFALICSLGALVIAIGMWPGASKWDGFVPEQGGVSGFSGLLVFDLFGLYLRIFLLGFLVLALWLALLTGIPDREDSADYCTLLVGGILGMMLMVSSNHLLTAFIAIEMASLPSYALAGFLKGKRQGSEAALKYVIYGASASGIMLYGISMLTGSIGSGSMTEIAISLATSRVGLTLPMIVGMVCILVGLAFKLSAVPFHFWCPDVFEGAAAEVGAFLSVASKAAALALTVRFLYGMLPGGITGKSEFATQIISFLVGIFAVVTATFGNLAALPQTNIKRLLAYSTIAHAGIMMLALTTVGPKAVGPVLLYISAYLLMNTGAFAVVALIRNRTGSEEIDAYRGLIHRSPVLAVAMTIFLLSLLGLPPLAGFAAKFEIFASLYGAGRKFTGEEAIQGWVFFGFLAAAAINTAIGAGYYLKIVRTMILDEPVGPAEPIPTSPGGKLFVILLAGLVIALGILWGPVAKLGDRAGVNFGPAFVVDREAKSK